VSAFHMLMLLSDWLLPAHCKHAGYCCRVVVVVPYQTDTDPFAAADPYASVVQIQS